MKKIICLTLALIMTLSTANVFAADYSSSQNYDALSALNSAVLLNTGNGSTITIYEWDSDTEAADAEEFGKSVKMEQVYSSSGTKAVTYVSSWPGKAYSGDTTVEFSIKRTDSDNNFYFWIRDTSNIPVLCFGSGKVTLLGTQICTYDKNVWYDVKLGVDFDNKYANIKIKNHSATEWKNYDVFYTASTLGITKWQRLLFGFNAAYPTTDKSTIYLDNYKVSVQDNIYPTYNSINDDFEKSATYTATSLTVSGYADGWAVQNTSTHTSMSNTTLDGVEGKVLEAVTTASGTTVYPTVFKEPISAASPAQDLRHNIKFKIGGSSDSGIKRATLRFVASTNLGATTGAANEYSCISLQSSSAYVAGSKTGINVKANTLYDAEIIYDVKNSIARFVLTDVDGTQYIGENTAILTKGYLGRIGFTNQTSVSSKMYLDDFEWNILETGVFSPQSIRYKTDEEGNIKVIATYNQTLYQQITTQNAQVTVTKDGETVSPEYTVTTNGNDMIVAFKNLDDTGIYQVTLSGAYNLSGEASNTEKTVEVAKFSIKSDSFTVENKKIHGFGGMTIGELKQNAVTDADITVYKADGLTVVEDSSFAETGMILRLTLPNSSSSAEYVLDVPHFLAGDVKINVNGMAEEEKFTTGKIASTVELTNYSSVPVNVISVIAQYSNSDGRMLDVNYNIERVQKGTSNVGAELEITSANDSYVKAFMIKMDTLIPMVDVKRLEAFSSDTIESVKFTYPNFGQKAVTFSYDDLIRDDDPTLISIFDEYGIKATFNLMTKRFSGPNNEVSVETAQNMYADVDVISHSYSHPYMYITTPTVISGSTIQPLTYDEVVADIKRSQEDMTLLRGAETIGFVWPYVEPVARDDYQQILEYIKTETGIKYIRPWTTSGNFNYPSDWYYWKVTCHHDDLPEYLPEFMETDAGDELLLLSVWGHSREFNPDKNPDDAKLHWDDIEAYAKQLAEDKTIWKADNTQIYLYKTAVDSAKVDYSAGTITNDSDVDVYAFVNGVRTVISANSTYSIK